MAEIVYEYPNPQCACPVASGIDWLGEEDYDVFAEHLRLCGQSAIDRGVWLRIHAKGTIYCVLRVEGRPVARACVEKYSPERWEVADVRVANAYRCRGYGEAVCLFVLKYILENGKTATIRTEADNAVMRRVIEKMGFAAR